MERPPDDETATDGPAWKALAPASSTTTLDSLKRRLSAIPNAAAAATAAFPGARLRRVVFGRNAAVSVALVFLAGVLAVGAADHVTTTVGYETLESWAHGTWTGTSPEPLAFVACGALVALGAASALANSGIVPTAVLVAAPVFGAAATRYGTTYVDPHLGARVVSLPEALAFAAAVAAVAAIPLAIAGFVLAAGLRTAAEPALAAVRDARD
ncbi:hypothetical protein [Halorubellus sp. PRR65]|uniref:hypothetical protein n=1 Tax=Halorubellus sp. PRR65 TaxID=3098148 RepID=UPI002B25F8D1|nr:hypothetical protein [Halorubellus sp. PRR65]